jgi:glutathione S-transferase
MQMPVKREGGNAALKLMDDHLKGREWFVDRAMSLADVCLFAYTHVAGEAEFDLDRYPAVEAWIDRVKHQHGFLPFDA